MRTLSEMLEDISNEVYLLEKDTVSLRDDAGRLSAVIGEQEKEIAELRREIMRCPDCQKLHELKQ